MSTSGSQVWPWSVLRDETTCCLTSPSSPGPVAQPYARQLAQKVLQGQTRGYKHHPQLRRFRETADPLEAIGVYLSVIADEADARGYRFDRTKILASPGVTMIPVTAGQVRYELEHLKRKLRVRDRKKLKEIAGATLRPHPIFKVRGGDVEPWESI